MSEQIEQEKTIHYNDAKIWQIAFFSMNNTAANLYLALMGYISYYAAFHGGLFCCVDFFTGNSNEYF